MSVTANGVSCTNVVQIGTKKVVADRGMNAFTVRQYKGYCRDAKGSAWMNFASVYVWQQYHGRGFAYKAYAGIIVRGELEPRGFKIGANRQRLTYSTPVRTHQRLHPGLGQVCTASATGAPGHDLRAVLTPRATPETSVTPDSPGRPVASKTTTKDPYAAERGPSPALAPRPAQLSALPRRASQGSR